MSLTSYRAAPSRGNQRAGECLALLYRMLIERSVFGRPGGDLLSRVLRRSTIGAEGFHGRVRDGIGCLAPRHDHQVVQARAGNAPVRCHCACSRRSARAVRLAAAGEAGEIKPIERLVPVSCAHRCASTPGLSTWWSTTALMGRTRFEVGFPLRCFQRLSRPHLATRRCRWRDNRYTRGASIPVLSY